MEIVSCKQAKAMGLKHYFTGKPCKRGHVSRRFVTGGCQICANEDAQRYYWQDPEKYRQLNREYHQQDDVKERNRIRQKEDYHRRPEFWRAMASWHRAQRLKRVVAWSETEQIREFYKNCPEGYEVDHIVPLQGELVSGLHVLGNLQYLPMAINRAKKNKFGIV